MTRVLLLGGSNEASRLAKALAEGRTDAVFSYAGRTRDPIPQPLPTRIGGFGGATGLVDYVTNERITHIVDATHPFAAGMSTNAVNAARETGLPLIALERPPWSATPQDRWHEVPDVASAVRALPTEPSRIFLAIGRQNIAAFADVPQHHYLLRLVDTPTDDLRLPNREVIISRGPFTVESDTALLKAHRIAWIVSKNSGGAAAGAKITAARDLGLPVIMIARPSIPERLRAETVEEVMAWLMSHHSIRLGV